MISPTCSLVETELQHMISAQLNIHAIAELYLHMFCMGAIIVPEGMQRTTWFSLDFWRTPYSFRVRADFRILYMNHRQLNPKWHVKCAPHKNLYSLQKLQMGKLNLHLALHDEPVPRLVPGRILEMYTVVRNIPPKDRHTAEKLLHLHVPNHS